jgi:Na+/H+ antiporter
VHGVETILFLVVLGTVVAAFAGRLRVPAPSLLVIAGLVVGLLPGFPPVHVSPEVVSLVVLPPLLYAASEELPWRDLRAVWRPVAVLAVGLVLASAAAVAAVTWAVAGVPATLAFVLGAVLASTDSVAVSALGRRLSLPPKVQALVQAESLFNDATSLVLFQVAVSFAVAGTAGTAGGVLLHAAGQFVVLAAGGAAVGGVIAAGLIPVRRVTDPVLETVLALITPYAAYLLGGVLGVSPVMAVIVAGLAIGARRERITTAQTRLQLHSVYGTVIFLLESVVFSLIGLQLTTLIRDLSGAEAWPAEALAVAGTLIVIRMLWVFPLSAVIQRRGGARRPSWPVPAVVSWAGTRGVVPLAAALSIPLTTASGAPLPRRDRPALPESAPSAGAVRPASPNTRDHRPAWDRSSSAARTSGSSSTIRHRPYGGELSGPAVRAHTTGTPRAAANAADTSASRVFPIPASPVHSTRRPRPATASSSRRVTRASSRSRPTISADAPPCTPPTRQP